MKKLIAFFRRFNATVLLIPLGAILLACGAVLFGIAARTHDFVKTDAVVTRATLNEAAYSDKNKTYHEATYRVFIRYTADGTEYEKEYGIFPGYREGDIIPVAYDPNDPKVLSQPAGYALPALTKAAGAAVLAVGVIITVKRRRTTV